jgi:hypothetical protein
MKLALLNDTSLTNNPGCRFTVENLINLYENNGHEILYRFPLGFGHGVLGDDLAINIPRNKFIRKSKLVMARLGRLMPPGLLESIEGVIINGEGTIHHGKTGEKVLMYLARFFKRSRKKVFLVNCTLQALERDSLIALEECVDYICVRELKSRDYLSAQGIDCTLGADALFLDGEFSDDTIVKSPNNGKCVFSPGVLSQFSEFDDILRELRLTCDLNFEFSYLPVEIEDLRHMVAAKESGMTPLPFPSRTRSSISGKISSADFLFSGRYHLVILALMMGVPVIPLRTNTWKIDGLMAMFKAPFLSSIDSHLGPVRAHKSKREDVLRFIQLAEFNCPLSEDGNKPA